MSVIDSTTLCGADTMRIMTGRTGYLLIEVPAMSRKTFIAEDAIAAVTFVAQGIGRFTLCRVVGGLILVDQKRGVYGAVGSPHPRVATAMTVCTVNHTGHCHGGFEARNERVDTP